MVCPGAAQRALPGSPGRMHVNVPSTALFGLAMPPQAPDSAVAQAYCLTAPQGSHLISSPEALHGLMPANTVHPRHPRPLDYRDQGFGQGTAKPG